MGLPELAKRLGVSVAQASRIETGNRPITAEMAVKIEEATDRQVPRWQLRPDLWPAPTPAEAAE